MMQSVEPSNRILALDYGTRRVGVAISDSLLLIAHRRKTIRNNSKKILFEQLNVIIAEEKISLIVVGMPRNMNGSEGKMAKVVKSFIAELQVQTQLQIVPWDERLSTKQAMRTLSSMGKRRTQKTGIVDMLAATIILQSYLDSIAFQNSKPLA